jgi:DNA-3-methyladenine glycosylase I
MAREDSIRSQRPGAFKTSKHVTRCRWAGTDETSDYAAYHDREWGVPVRDDRTLFEFLILEGAQAGLSWATILRKRARYREVFDGFDPARVARFTERKKAALLADPGIVRNRLKVEAAVTNARATLDVQREFGSLAAWLWQFVGDAPVQNAWRAHEQVPASTEMSDRMSRELKKRGFRFVGSTICYAFMQAVGMVNDHTLDCFRYRELSGRNPRAAPRRAERGE